jgi:phospholipid-binding lipoprotein MlaA
MTKCLRATFAVASLLLVAGCSFNPKPFPSEWHAPTLPPIDALNRQVFWLNDQIDVHALEPVARGWDFVCPDPVQRGLNNFFDNLRFPIVLVNDILQGQPRLAYQTVARFSSNTILGGLGFVDIASERGIPPHIQDMGLTFGRWGIPAGPYLVLPLLGPSNPRDAMGLVGDSALAIYPWFITVPGITVGATAVDLVNRRSRVLDQVQDVKAASVDYFAFVRDAFIQRRWKLIHGEAVSNGPREDELYNTEIYEDFIEEGN